MMLFYQVFFVLFVSFCLLGKYIKQQEVVEYFLIIVLATVAGIRYDIGSDFEMYLRRYNEYPLNINNFEPGFWLFGTIFKFLGFSYPIYFWTIAFITLVLLKKTISLLKIDFYYALIIYLGYHYVNYNFNILRHGLMISMGWLGIANYYLGNKKKFYFWTLLGSLFHISGLLILFIPLINKIKLDLKLTILLLTLFFVAGYFIYFPGIIKFLSPDPDTAIGFKIQRYFLTYYLDKPKTAYGISIGTILNIFILIFTIIVKRRFNKQDESLVNLLINCLFVGLSLLFLFNSLSVLVERWSNMFYFSLIFLLPMLPRAFSLRSNKLLIYFFIIIISFLYWNKTLNSREPTGEYQFLPYKTYLNK